MLNGRITTEQMEWLHDKADELGGNLSAALRQALTDARLFEMARNDYRDLCATNPDFEIPMVDHGEGPVSRVLAVALAFNMTDEEDHRLRELEARENGTESCDR